MTLTATIAVTESVFAIKSNLPQSFSTRPWTVKEKSGIPFLMCKSSQQSLWWLEEELSLESFCKDSARKEGNYGSERDAGKALKSFTNSFHVVAIGIQFYPYLQSLHNFL